MCLLELCFYLGIREIFLQVPNTPLVSKTFLHLKYLSITLSEGAFSPYYDRFSVVSFLDAAPSLETLLLGVSHC